jgi:hypothetical protein
MGGTYLFSDWARDQHISRQKDIIENQRNRITRLERELNKCGWCQTMEEVRAIVGRTIRRRKKG